MANKCTSAFEFDYLLCEDRAAGAGEREHRIPSAVFAWLKTQALQAAQQEGKSLRYASLCSRHGQEALQLRNFVGVLQAPCGYQIEVLPKLGKALGNEPVDASRILLLQMLQCLREFRHIETDKAQLLAREMPLLEVFIAEFLRCVGHVVKRGLRSDYVRKEDNLFALRGKLLMAQHLRQNLCRRDRFYTAFDEFSPNRAENRLLHSALKRVAKLTQAPANQRLARELCFVFADIPTSTQIQQDFQKIRSDRGMAHYEPALAWARLILADDAPLTGQGENSSPSLLFPMEAVFEAYVAKHLRGQLTGGYGLKKQSNAEYLVRHKERNKEGDKKGNWFNLKPDLLIKNETGENRVVLDTKWKLLDEKASDSKSKYGLSQADFYQLYAYGQYYLGGKGDLVLIYPKTDTFTAALPVFEFTKPDGSLRLWVLPFDLDNKRLLLPADHPLVSVDIFSMFSPSKAVKPA
jgi:5-methylcytosine-specific restriction enzyme subunit McrC